ncbi:NUDIX domain-containing protein [Fomitopsis serialis]|uniref:NUDIX domain-containing protein n=1 Tax=Fomitopsis serialis TaxID=139415 RepID=UPI002008A1BB|nr:NUDIX domain-containing protein [Neoantrodia serialis]KAH9928172.1 NUDIX domain-containing protein [Neoantrodia serialis]
MTLIAIWTASLRRRQAKSAAQPRGLHLSPRRTAPVAGTMSSKAPSSPRQSASVIIVNPQNEVLLVQRNPKSQSFAGAHVFPGGNYDQKQDDSVGMTAIREVFEETGLLLASKVAGTGSGPSDAETDHAREEIHSQRQLFRDFLSEHGLEADLSSLWPFTQWITPPTIPRRFHTQFTGFISGGKQERLPTPDGGQEVIAARFVHPLAALAEARARNIVLMPPQVYLLTTMRTPLWEQEHGGAAGTRPRVLGRTVLTYQGDEARGGAKGRLHRCVCKFQKDGVATDVVLQRNFDVFTELESVLSSSSSSKL